LTHPTDPVVVLKSRNRFDSGELFNVRSGESVSGTIGPYFTFSPEGSTIASSSENRVDLLSYSTLENKRHGISSNHET
ncbi:MAG: hypothetical protein GWO24_02945, partial [Akkermansiaceae bacterium]|nr:hypothetical protein [Akkermansiaceae bacterium]